VAKPQHPWQELNLVDLFKNIGGWRQNRQSGEEGITLAGILMFGLECHSGRGPNYFVDYRERDDAQPDSRWIDRIYRMAHGQAMFLIFTAGLIEN
jgi:hypothetical protein